MVEEVPPPSSERDVPARAPLFDSFYDVYRGVITYVRVMVGGMSTRDQCMMMSTGKDQETLEVADPGGSGAADRPAAGEVGYVIPGVKTVRQERVGDTVTTAAVPRRCPLTVTGTITAHGLHRPVSDDRQTITRP